MPTTAPARYRSEDPDADFTDYDESTALADVAAYTQELGRPLNLRWVYTHMLPEYARHLGHADLLRECIDGGTRY